VWVESNFDGIIPALKARKFDAILSGMYMTEKRKAQIAFSDKLYNGPVFLVARKNTLTGNTPEQLKGKTIGVEQGSAQETYVNQHWRPRGLTSWPIRGPIAWCGIWSPGVLMARCSPDDGRLQLPAAAAG
jgi:membrane-bound lytic murein transglycosylase MltF